MGTDAFDGGGGREITLEAKDRQAVGEGQGGKGEEKDEHRRVVHGTRAESCSRDQGHYSSTIYRGQTRLLAAQALAEQFAFL